MLPLSLSEQIDTERLTLQRLSYEDADQLFFAYASKPEATRFMCWPTHQSIKDTRDYLKYSVSGWNQGVDYSYSIRLRGTGRIIGSWGLINDDGKVQFGYILSPTQWGNGFATEACLKMLSLLKSIHGVFRIGSFVDTENTASIRVLQKSGMVEEAILLKWHRFINQGNEPKDCILFKMPFF